MQFRRVEQTNVQRQLVWGRSFCLVVLHAFAPIAVVAQDEGEDTSNGPLSIAAILQHAGAFDEAHDLVYHDGYLYVSGQGDNRFVILRVDSPEIRRLARKD